MLALPPASVAHPAATCTSSMPTAEGATVAMNTTEGGAGPVAPAAPFSREAPPSAASAASRPASCPPAPDRLTHEALKPVTGSLQTMRRRNGPDCSRVAGGSMVAKGEVRSRKMAMAVGASVAVV